MTAIGTVSDGPIALPRLLALEGPAGVGKTTVSRQLAEEFAQRGVVVGYVPEFSDSPLGVALAASAAYGLPTREPWIGDLPGLTAFVADKAYAISRAITRGVELCVADRMFTTELVLALPFVTERRSREIATSLVGLAFKWSRPQFSDGLLVFLDADLPQLEQRLALRLARALTPTERAALRVEVERYRTLAVEALPWGVACVSANAPLETVVREVADLATLHLRIT